MLALAESMSVAKPKNGWFIPSCDHTPTFLDQRHEKERRTVQVQSFENEDAKQNVLQTLNNWVKTGEKHQAIDPFGVMNEACSEAKSLPLDLRPDALLPEIQEDGNGELRQAPRRGYNRRYGPFGRRNHRGRFYPPADLFPQGYYGSTDHVVPDAAAGYDPYDIFDYDGLALGPDFDFPIEHSGAIIPTAAEAADFDSAYPVSRRRPAVVAGPAVIAGGRRPGVIAGGYPRRRPGVAVRTGVAHAPQTRARLWRKLYYLDHLRRLYRQHYHQYRNEYYGSGIPVAEHVPVVHDVVSPGVISQRARPNYFARIQEQQKDDGDLKNNEEFPDEQFEDFRSEKLSQS